MDEETHELIDGEAADDPGQATQRLLDAGELEREVEVVIRKRGSDTPETLHVRSEAALGDLGRISFPFLFDRRESAAGDAFSLGPLSTLVWWRARRELHHELRPDEASSLGLPGFASHYEQRLEWGALGNLVHWERTRDLRTGEERSCLRLLWLLSFGDDL